MCLKRITVFPEQSLSLQSHSMRNEIWIITEGNPTIDNKVWGPGDMVIVPMGEKHRIQNFSTTRNVVLTEIQFGPICSEEDIIRYEDAYGRPVQKETKNEKLSGERATDGDIS